MGSFVVFGVDLVALSNSINWYLILYAILSVVATVYGCFRLYEGGGGVRASVYGIVAGLVFVFFGYRWFSNPTSISKKWPPVINMCPDYLTYVQDVKAFADKSKNGGGCVDMLGVSTGSLRESLPSDVTALKSDRGSVSRDKFFRYTSADVTAATSVKELNDICKECNEKGVTWEGVYDGDVCIAIKTVDARNAALANCVVSA